MFDFAKARIPLLRFDGGAEGHCFPDFASDQSNGICRDFNKFAPIYYDFKECGDYGKLVWWIWYGWQGECIWGNGDHDNDWEHITVNFIKNSGSGLWEQDSVTWFQHSGCYTRDVKDTHPNIYVGKNAHGSYDNWCDGKGFIWEQDYCQGGCLYWDDFRNDNENSRWTPTNIRHVSTVTGKVAERITGEKYFNDKRLHSCIGDDIRCASESPCGCWRNNHVFPAPVCDV